MKDILWLVAALMNIAGLGINLYVYLGTHNSLSAVLAVISLMALVMLLAVISLMALVMLMVVL